MNFCSCDPIITLSDYGKKITCKLKLCLFTYIALCIIKLVFGSQFNLFNELLLIFFLVMTYRQLSFFMAQLTVFLISIQLFFDLIMVFLIIQDYFFAFPIIVNLNLLLRGITLLMLIILLIYTFLAYREYKGLYYEQIGAGEYSPLKDGYNNHNDTIEMNNNQNRSYVPFGGQGSTWG